MKRYGTTTIKSNTTADVGGYYHPHTQLYFDMTDLASGCLLCNLAKN